MLELTGTEKPLADRLQALLTLLAPSPKDSERDAYLKNLKELGEKGHALHKSLTARGHEPKQRRHMIEGRGMQPDHPEFYQHIHPAQALLEFIDDPDAAGDPPDLTIGAEFQFRVFSRRWRRHDTYRVTRTAGGWNIRHMTIGGDGNKRGEPALFASFRQDSIQYPRGIGDYFEWLWDQARDQGLDAAAVQAALDRLAEWVSTTEQAAPSDGLFSGV